MLIMNDLKLLERFEKTVFIDARLTYASLTRFKHFVQKYVPFEAEFSQPDYMTLAQEVIRYLFGEVWVDPALIASIPEECQASPPPPSPPSPLTERTAMENSYNVERLTYIDGVCLDHMSDGEIVARIAAIEKDMKSLAEIKTDSKAIKRQLKKMGATTKLLADFLDSRVDDDEDD